MISPRPPRWAAAAAGRVRRTPLRWCRDDPGRGEREIEDSGYFLGAEECARSLGSEAAVDRWHGFSARWPVLIDRGWLVAPAVPVALAETAVDGPDGVYRRRGARIVREAAGTEAVLLSAQAAPAGSEADFDLLWFGETERWLLRGDTLEIDDLFSRSSVPATAARLDRLLVRARRMPAELIAGLPTATGRTGSRVAVARPLALMGTGESWREPAAYLAARGDVRSVRQSSAGLAVELLDARSLEFSRSDRCDGWSLELSAGRSSVRRLTLHAGPVRVVLEAEIDAAVDLLATGVRARLAFDLQADLVALARQNV